MQSRNYVYKPKGFIPSTEKSNVVQREDEQLHSTNNHTGAGQVSAADASTVSRSSFSSSFSSSSILPLHPPAFLVNHENALDVLKHLVEKAHGLLVTTHTILPDRSKTVSKGGSSASLTIDSLEEWYADFSLFFDKWAPVIVQNDAFVDLLALNKLIVEDDKDDVEEAGEASPVLVAGARGERHFFWLGSCEVDEQDDRIADFDSRIQALGISAPIRDFMRVILNSHLTKVMSEADETNSPVASTDGSADESAATRQRNRSRTSGTQRGCDDDGSSDGVNASVDDRIEEDDDRRTYATTKKRQTPAPQQQLSQSSHGHASWHAGCGERGRTPRVPTCEGVFSILTPKNDPFKALFADLTWSLLHLYTLIILVKGDCANNHNHIRLQHQCKNAIESVTQDCILGIGLCVNGICALNHQACSTGSSILGAAKKFTVDLFPGGLPFPSTLSPRHMFPHLSHQILKLAQDLKWIKYKVTVVALPRSHESELSSKTSRTARSSKKKNGERKKNDEREANKKNKKKSGGGDRSEPTRESSAIKRHARGFHSDEDEEKNESGRRARERTHTAPTEHTANKREAHTVHPSAGTHVPHQKKKPLSQGSRESDGKSRHRRDSDSVEIPHHTSTKRTNEAVNDTQEHEDDGDADADKNFEDDSEAEELSDTGSNASSMPSGNNSGKLTDDDDDCSEEEDDDDGSSDYPTSGDDEARISQRLAVVSLKTMISAQQPDVAHTSKRADEPAPAQPIAAKPTAVKVPQHSQIAVSKTSGKSWILSRDADDDTPTEESPTSSHQDEKNGFAGTTTHGPRRKALTVSPPASGISNFNPKSVFPSATSP